MTVAELIRHLQALPQDAVVVLPHWWEIDDDRCHAVTADNVEVIDAVPADSDTFTPASRYAERGLGHDEPVKVVQFR